MRYLYIAAIVSGSLLLCDIAVPVDGVDGNQDIAVAHEAKRNEGGNR